METNPNQPVTPTNPIEPIEPISAPVNPAPPVSKPEATPLNPQPQPVQTDIPQTPKSTSIFAKGIGAVAGVVKADQAIKKSNIPFLISIIVIAVILGGGYLFLKYYVPGMLKNTKVTVQPVANQIANTKTTTTPESNTNIPTNSSNTSLSGYDKLIAATDNCTPTEANLTETHYEYYTLNNEIIGKSASIDWNSTVKIIGKEGDKCAFTVKVNKINKISPDKYFYSTSGTTVRLTQAQMDEKMATEENNAKIYTLVTASCNTTSAQLKSIFEKAKQDKTSIAAIIGYFNAAGSMSNLNYGTTCKSQ